MRRPFHTQIRTNRWRLGLFLLLYLFVTLVAGYLVGLALEPVLDPVSARERWVYEVYLPWEDFQIDGHYPRPFPDNAVALVTVLFMAAAVGYYAWVWKRGGGAILTLTGASRLQRRQLDNTAQEMSVAAGRDRPTRVWIVEDPSLNAFACEDPAGRGAVVVTRGLLETLSRGELQAVMAHETGHLVNGDTRLMTLLFGVSRMLDVVLWIGFFQVRLLAWMFRKGKELEVDEDEGAVMEGVGDADREPRPEGLDDAVEAVLRPDEETARRTGPDGRPDPWIEDRRIRNLRRALDSRGVLFLTLTSLFVLALWIFGVGLAVGVPVLLVSAVHWRIWGLLIAVPLGLLVLRMAVSRNREYQADATAVRLTRNPGALRSALEKLRAGGRAPTRLRPSIAHLCIAPLNRRAGRGNLAWVLEATLLEDGSILTAEARRAVWRTARELPAWKRPAAWLHMMVFSGGPLLAALRSVDAVLGAFETHPPLEERIRRVGEMGAVPAPAERG